MFMFICLAVIQLLHVTPGIHKSFQSLATTVLFFTINVFLVMLCFQTNKLDDEYIRGKCDEGRANAPPDKCPLGQRPPV